MSRARGFSEKAMKAAILAAAEASPGAIIIFQAPGGQKITILPPRAANPADMRGEVECDMGVPKSLILHGFPPILET